jgi:hypothetical protein
MEHVLVTRPIHDPVVAYLSAYAELTLKLAKQRGFHVNDLHSTKAIRKNVESVIKRQKPKFVFFNGHGNETRITGHEDKVLIECGKNENLLKSKITYAVACKSAKQLGAKYAKDQSTAFVGYEEDFVFFMDKNRATTPLKDKYVKPIFLASNQVVISILKGKTVNQAYIKSQQIFEKQIALLKRSKELEAPYILQALVWNMFWQRSLGNSNLDLSS